MGTENKTYDDSSLGEGVLERWRTAVSVYRRLDLSARISFWVLLVIFSAALFAPYIAPHDPSRQLAVVNADPSLQLAEPSAAHPMGTDVFGRDVFSRLLFGARSSLIVGVLAVGMAGGVGVTSGAIAGYVGGWLDETIMRVMDVLISFPALVLALALVGALGDSNIFLSFPLVGDLLVEVPWLGDYLAEEASVFNVVFVIGFVYSPQFARLTRGQVLSVKENEYVEAAKNTGVSHFTVLFRHVLPNAMAPILVQATFLVASAILFEASLSYLGLGVQPPKPTWGVMISKGQGYLPGSWWWSTFPGLAIMVTVLALNLLGDGLRDEFDPRSATEGGPEA